jgi:ABC-type glycerol-3-phosphate transport system permease component
MNDKANEIPSIKSRQKKIGDLKLLADLLSEYSSKLKLLVDKVQKIQQDFFLTSISVATIVSLTITILTFFSSSIAGYELGKMRLVSVPLATIFQFMLFPIITVALFRLYFSFRRTFYQRTAFKKEISITKNQLEAVINLASQVEDHVSDNDVERLLFRFRIIEAEAAIEFVKNAI